MIDIGETYYIPSFSEQYMENFTANEVACKLKGHVWVGIGEDHQREYNKMGDRKTKTIMTYRCSHCYAIRTVESITVDFYKFFPTVL